MVQRKDLEKLSTRLRFIFYKILHDLYWLQAVAARSEEEVVLNSSQVPCGLYGIVILTEGKKSWLL